MAPDPPVVVRAVLFDFGGTLVDEGDFPQWVEEARGLGIAVDEYHLAHAWHAVELESDGPTPPSKAERWREILSRASDRPIDAKSADAFVERIERRPPAHRLYSDTKRCLVQLRDDGRRLGVVSNSRSEDGIRGALDRAGIAGYFEAVLSSGTEGVAKPDPEIFRRAIARMNVRASETVYVGDLPYRDAKAAQRAGLHAVWLNREGTGFGDDPPEITSLTELPFHVLELEGRTGERSR